MVHAAPHSWRTHASNRGDCNHGDYLVAILDPVFVPPAGGIVCGQTAGRVGGNRRLRIEVPRLIRRTAYHIAGGVNKYHLRSLQRLPSHFVLVHSPCHSECDVGSSRINSGLPPRSMAYAAVITLVMKAVWACGNEIILPRDMPCRSISKCQVSSQKPLPCIRIRVTSTRLLYVKNNTKKQN